MDEQFDIPDEGGDNDFADSQNFDSDPEFLHEPNATGQKSAYWKVHYLITLFFVRMNIDNLFTKFI